MSADKFRCFDIEDIYHLFILVETVEDCIDQGHYEEAILKLQKCLRWADDPERRAAILDNLGTVS